MRLPVITTLSVLFLSIVVDYYLWRRLKEQSCNRFWQRFQLVTAVIFNLVFLTVICLPKRQGGDAGFERLMWVLYAYFSVYIPKYLFTLFDLAGAIPLIFRRKRVGWLSAAGFVVAAVVFTAMCWGALINRYNIDVNRVEIEIAGLPQAFDGMTVAQISDLHVGSYGSDTSFVSKVVERVNALSPDLVVFTGDLVNRKTSELYPFVHVLSRLQGRKGVYSVLGNHDYGDYYSWPSAEAKRKNMEELKSLQAEMGWRLLNNESVAVVERNDSIILIGVENVGDPPFRTYGDLDAAYGTLEDSNTKILLSHNPAHWLDDIKDAPDKNIALTLAGHTHAMQMSAFGVSPAALRYPTWGGLYSDDDNHQLYVNIGVGEVAIPARIGATPEITLITLRHK